MFIGTYEIKLDKKCRFHLPERFFLELSASRGSKRDAYFAAADILCCYSSETITNYFDEMKNSDKCLNVQQRNMLMRLTAKEGAAKYSFTGLIEIPALFAKTYKLEPNSEIVLVGCGGYFEIWPRQNWILQQVTSRIEQKKKSLRHL